MLLVTCRDVKNSEPPNPPTVPANYDEAAYQDLSIPDSVLYDKILGSLVGSAIGDALGAPTEMWTQDAISEEYGHVSGFDVVLREPSPEGPWDFNLPPGAGTDDTRWKALTVRYLVEAHHGRRPGEGLTLGARGFANYINGDYERTVSDLKQTAGVEPRPFEDNMRRLTWLQEWAKVSRAYVSEDIDAYRDATSKFYGGEMACAGMLYAPALAAAFPGKPEMAYRAAYDLSIFDIGYARDVTGITAALTAAAFGQTFTRDTMRGLMRDVDPQEYFRSRLLGRVAYNQYRSARAIVRNAQALTEEEARTMTFRLPENYPYDSLTYARTLRAYEGLRAASQDVPFHAGEIHLINLTGLLISNFDFRRALEFVTNYGRDNDTVAAVTGAILGALHGFSNLPEDQREQVLRINREVLDIDLEDLAGSLTQAVLSRRPAPRPPQPRS